MYKLNVYKTVLLALVAWSALAMFELAVVRIVGRVGIGLLFGISLLIFCDIYVLQKTRLRYVAMIPFGVVLLVCVYLLGAVYRAEISAAKFVFTFVGTFFCIFSFAYIYAKVGVNRSDQVFGYAILFMLAGIGFLDDSDNKFIKYNLLGKMFFASCYFPLLFAEARNRFYPVSLILLLVFSVYTGSKIVMALWFVVSLVWVFGRNNLTILLLRPLTFYALFSLVIGAYMYLSSADIASAINRLTNSYIGGNFFTNREDIWPAALSYAKGNCVWFGCGFEVSMAPIIGKDMSVHNSFLEVFVQGGVPLLLFVFTFFHVMFPAWSARYVVPRLFWCAFMIVAASETILFQSKTGLMLIFVPAIAHWASGRYLWVTWGGDNYGSKTRLAGNGV